MTQVKTNLKKLPIVFLTMIIIATSLVITGCGKTVINIEESKMLNVELTGFNGKGTATVMINEDKREKFWKKFKEEKNYTEIRKFIKSIEFELEDESINGTISNGDTINIVVKYDEDIAEEAKISLEKDVIAYEVKKNKLKDATEIDAFKGFKLTYSGDNGDAYAFTDDSGCDPVVGEAGVYFTVDSDNNGSLKNGDKITVKAEYSQYRFEEEGYYLKEESKEFTVDGLAGARETFDGVDFADIAEKLLDEAEDDTAEDIYLAYYDYKFNSGKERELNSFDFTYTPTLELVKYAYAYDSKDIEYENCLVAYYKLTVDVECTSDQSSFYTNPMKKGDKDTGVCYIAVKTDELKVASDNTIVDDYIYYTLASGLTLEDCTKELGIEKYTTEYFDASYKKIDDSAVTTEPATEAATEKATTEAATEAATEKATTEAATEAATEAPTKKA